ncbi:membrane protein [Candidatus Mancarchaeum acidiphilum]|uniref:Membrane protein n=1 Tax=Candidatus Mancarchaeum acidiphilum TaxID=1920749 RepID=A0A218NNH8_9ARCH|nr:hypothetical protein [Candidatus Mancarchaeum acidiphilum]ASI14038.1 membrane protein [Candidatus Mancarchaeum acidiphilum]
MSKSSISNNRCIICGQQKPGLHVKDDFVLDSIRWIKRNITKNEKGYKLVVCKEDYKKYLKERNKYIRRQIFYIAIGIVFAALLIIMSGGSIGAILFGLAIILLLYLLSLLSYIPAVDLPEKFVSKDLKGKYDK